MLPRDPLHKHPWNIHFLLRRSVRCAGGNQEHTIPEKPTIEHKSENLSNVVNYQSHLFHHLQKSGAGSPPETVKSVQTVALIGTLIGTGGWNPPSPRIPIPFYGDIPEHLDRRLRRPKTADRFPAQIRESPDSRACCSLGRSEVGMFAMAPGSGFLRSTNEPLKASGTVDRWPMTPNWLRIRSSPGLKEAKVAQHGPMLCETKEAGLGRLLQNIKPYQLNGCRDPDVMIQRTYTCFSQ